MLDNMIERMDAFFTARVDTYDEHMLQEVEGCAEGYRRMAQLLPPKVETLLDLGCGTGLELHEIFRRFPKLAVTGIDLTEAMLQRLEQKFADRNLTLIHASYFDVDLGRACFDAAVSFQTMHHFTHNEKRGLYSRIHAALKEGGQYIECDYMIEDQEEEDFYFQEIERLRKEQGITAGTFCHYDTPCTIENQLRLFREAGFSRVEVVYRQENTTMIVAQK